MQIMNCHNLVGELLGSIIFKILAHHDIFPNDHHNTGGRGRITVTDDSAVTVGAEVEVQAEQVLAVNATKETKEISVDPISFSRYCMILTWAIEQGNIFVWKWTILHWNLMAPSISIDPWHCTILRSLKTILLFVKIQQSLTNKVRRHTKKLSIVTLQTRFYVLASVWVSGIIEPKHLPSIL